MTETVAHGPHLRVLSESYLMHTNMTGFRWFSKQKSFHPCALNNSSPSIGRVNVSAITYIQKIVHFDYFICNLSCYVPFCCRAAAILGYLPQELLGTSVYEYYHQDDVTHMAEAHKKGKLNTNMMRKQSFKCSRSSMIFLHSPSNAVTKCLLLLSVTSFCTWTSLKHIGSPFIWASYLCNNHTLYA